MTAEASTILQYEATTLPYHQEQGPISVGYATCKRRTDFER